MDDPTPDQILVVEDDLAVIAVLEATLTNAGYAVSVARDGRQALTMLRKIQFDLVILDVVMPQMDGWKTLRKIREISTVPVLMLTGQAADSDQILGLELGADDYITKPASVAVIRARVRAALRRARQPLRPEEPILNFAEGVLVIDQQSGQVRVAGAAVDLTPTEYKLLIYLVSNAGQTIPHREVLAAVWGPGYDDPEILKLFISRLRAKIEPDPAQPRFIRTKRGRGYYFRLSS